MTVIRTLSKPELLELERMVDTTSLEAVVEHLAEICREKADHVSTNWQDKATARYWSDCAARLEAFAPRLSPGWETGTG